MKIMNHDLVVSESIDINRPVADIWNTMTNPKIIKEYLFGTETITNWEVGSGIVFQGEYGDNNEYYYRDKGVITENIKHKQLSYTYWSGFSGLEDKPENYSLVTYTLTEKGPDCTNLRW